MREVNRELCRNSIHQTQRVLDSYDPVLASLFSEISNLIVEECLQNDSAILIDNVVRNLNNINIVPGEFGDCHETCVALFTGKWNSKKNGLGNIDKLLFPYWFRCLKNKYTLVITSAWDEKSFNEKLKNSFDSHAVNNKPTVVILLTSMGFSIQYLH